MKFVERTIGAICAEIARGEGCSPEAGAAAAVFARRQLGNAPGFLRPLLILATVFFGLCGWRRGAPFHRLAPEVRRRQMLRWRASPLQPFRDLMRFYDSLGLLAVYSSGRAERPDGR